MKGEKGYNSAIAYGNRQGIEQQTSKAVHDQVYPQQHHTQPQHSFSNRPSSSTNTVREREQRFVLRSREGFNEKNEIYLKRRNETTTEKWTSHGQSY